MSEASATPSPTTAEACVARMVRPEIQALTPYKVAKAAGLIKLDAMENPYPLPESLRARLATAVAATPIHRYPDGGASALRDALRDAFRVPAELGVLTGNGSDELIQIMASILARPGATIVAPEPSFVMYRMNAVYSGMRYRGVPLRRDFSLDIDAMLRAIAETGAALVFIAYPNNPTGNLFARRDVERILEAAPGLVVIDEAYQAFADSSWLPELARWPNALVLRTLSKTGMAGLRLGYAVAAQPWIDAMDKVRQPYNVNALTQAIVPELLQERATFAGQAAAIRAERERLSGRLARIPGVTVFPSQTNFVLARVPDATRWFGRLLDHGILIKNLDGTHPLLEKCLRFTVGTPEENDAVLAALESS